MYLTFGPNMEYHVQAYLSMLSFYKQMTKEDRIVMVTNMPQYYKYAEKWADIIAIDNQQIKEWEGPHHYRFRIKTMAMKQQVENHPNEHLLFVDTDTFLYGKQRRGSSRTDEECIIKDVAHCEWQDTCRRNIRYAAQYVEFRHYWHSSSTNTRDNKPYHFTFRCHA